MLPQLVRRATEFNDTLHNMTFDDTFLTHSLTQYERYFYLRTFSVSDIKQGKKIRIFMQLNYCHYIQLMLIRIAMIFFDSYIIFVLGNYWNRHPCISHDWFFTLRLHF